MLVVSNSSSICSYSETLLAKPGLAHGKSCMEAEMLFDLTLLFPDKQVEEGTAMQTFLQRGPQEYHWDQVSHFTWGYSVNITGGGKG